MSDRRLQFKQESQTSSLRTRLLSRDSKEVRARTSGEAGKERRGRKYQKWTQPLGRVGGLKKSSKNERVSEGYQRHRPVNFSEEKGESAG